MHTFKSINKIIYSKSSYYLYIYVFLFIISIKILLNGPQVVGDTGAYMHYYYNRPILIPLLMNLFYWISANYFDYLYLLFQLIIAWISVIYTCNCLRNYFSFSKIQIFVISVILCYPYYSSPYIANILASEGVAYPLFLFMFSNLINYIKCRKLLSIYFVFINFILLIMTREQFYFLVPVVLLISVIHILEKNFKKIIKLLILFILSLIILNVSERTMNLIYHNKFETTKSNRWLITPAFFVSNEIDANLFAEDDKKEFFLTVYKKIQKDSLLANQMDDKTLNIAKRYYNIVENMFYLYINPELIKKIGHLEPNTLEYNFDKLENMQNLCNDISYKLLKANLSIYMKLVLNYFIIWNGGIVQLIYIFIVLIFSTYCLIIKISKYYLFNFFIITMIIFNSFLLSLFQAYVLRFIIYTNSLFYISLLINLYLITNKKIGKGNKDEKIQLQ